VKITTDRTIQRLLDLDLLERRVPATENAAKSRRASYVIGDPYYRFYFRFIAPAAPCDRSRPRSPSHREHHDATR
jgi:AAA+ ATPase superfamily predicted ATPase